MLIFFIFFLNSKSSATENLNPHIYLDYLSVTKNREKIEKFLAQNFLKQIMSQLLDYTKKLTKNREK